MPKLLYEIAASAFVGLVSASPAQALELKYPPIPGIGQPGETLDSLSQISLGQLAQFTFAAALWLAGVMALGVLLYVGFTFTTSGGNPWKKMLARQRLEGLFVGTIILLGLYIFVGFLNPELLTLKNVGLSLCSIDAQGKSTCQISFPKLPLLVVPGSQGGSGGSGGTPPPATPIGVYLYKHTEFAGSETYLISSDPDLIDNTIGNNEASSAIISGSGTFTFYDDTNYAGAWVEIKRTGNDLECRTSLIDPTTSQNELCDAVPRQLQIRSDNLLYIHLREIAHHREGMICIGCAWEDKIESVEIKPSPGGGTGEFACPIPANCSLITTEFGDLGAISGLIHNAIDVGCAIDQPITAPFAGTVTSASFIEQCGLQVTISSAVDSVDGKKWTTKFCHMNSIAVNSGDDVTVGTFLGSIDSTGASVGNHAHICLQKGGTGQCWQNEDTTINVNPENYMSCHFTH